jgi:hypothetical protein
MDQFQQTTSAGQYAELGEDDLIDLLAQKTEHSYLDEREQVEELRAIIEALKARREASAPARARIGEYLRQKALYDATQKHRETVDEQDSLRADQYAKTASLRLSDLRHVVSVPVKDTKAIFLRVQEERLTQWQESDEYKKLPPKQQALLPCVAKGHIEYGYSGWRGSEACCRDTHGATFNSLTGKKHIVTTLTKAGFRSGFAYLMLAKPTTP